MKFTAILLIACFWVAHASGQTYNLPQMLELGRANYPSIKARAADARGARLDASAASLDYLPRISAQHQYTYATSNSMAGSFYNNPTVISPAGGIRADNNINTATWGSYTSVLLEWNVFNFGKVAGNVKAARSVAESSQAAYENELFQHQVRVADAYLLALMAEKLSAIQQVNMERALRFREVVSAGVTSGMRAGVDSSLASAEYSRTKLTMLDAERNYKSAQLRLLELAGMVDQSSIDVDSLYYLTTIPARPEVSFNAVTNPLLNLYRKRVDATQARSIAIKRSFLPSITLVGAAWARGSGVYNDDSFHTDFASGTKYQVNNYLLGAALRWTITDFASVHQRYRAEHSRAVRDQELYNEQSLGLQRQIKDSDMQFNVSLEQAKMAPVQLVAAQQAYQQASARYKSGLTDLPTLLQSMFTLNRAEADVAIAYVNVWRSLLAVAASEGDFTIFTNSLP